MARLSQNCIERLFGIIPQSLGPNDHPTPAQFLILANSLSFYNLAKLSTGGSVSKGVLRSLLCAEDTEKTARDQLDALLEAGKLHKVEEALVEDDHASCIEETSDSRLIYYMAGYAERKCITKKRGCGACKSTCFRTSTPTAAVHPASYMRHIDRGGLLFVTDQVFKLISHLEKVFTRCFSRRKLHANSTVDILSCVGASVPAVGVRKRCRWWWLAEPPGNADLSIARCPTHRDAAGGLLQAGPADADGPAPFCLEVAAGLELPV
ncbi:hypothetical protein HPB47_013389 [Ixodes persulcatus]|uniref:Uncharacterized protein n=1 Tax=Ixodes persulcatus TaxID=34615 RepID=A0AC60R1B1_IXOPE|nr:hypothetical protein HPB47_013389 [Ixodes persulcatus]